MRIPLWRMVQKRAGWLVILFLGEMLTATAMANYEDEIAKAVVLALFLPLIISSGGNSGSQASTLIIRAMALGEVTLRDWWRVASRELQTGLSLGLILGVIGTVRVAIWSIRRGAIFSSQSLRAALAARRLDRRRGPRRGGALGLTRGLHVALSFAAARCRPSDFLRALRRHPGRRHRADHLLQHRAPHHAGRDVMNPARRLRRQARSLIATHSPRARESATACTTRM